MAVFVLVGLIFSFVFLFWPQLRSQTMTPRIPSNLEPDNEAILNDAAALIRAHKFSEARNLLSIIPTDPTAQAWLKKLADPRYQI